MSGPSNGLRRASRSEACERLALSRERLRQALQPEPRSRPGGGGFDWNDLFKSVPGAPAVLQALRAWWSQTPMNGPVRMAAAAVQSWVQPLAQRHPFSLVMAAMAAGALLMATRPWRWLPQAALRSGLWAGLPGLMAAVVSRWPVHTWLQVLAELLNKAPPPTPNPPAAEAGDRDQPSASR
jgi:uncharacterized protein YfiM (DUF2279 family)